MKKEFEKFVISQVCVLIRDNKCLILEFSDRSGVWGLPGGRIDEGEEGEMAFKREMKEELNLESFDILGMVDYDIWRNHKGIPMCSVVNFVKNDFDEIKLSKEHSKMAWVTKEEIDNYKFAWPNATRMLKKGFEYRRLISK